MTITEIHRQNISDMQRALTLLEPLLHSNQGIVAEAVLYVVQHACKAVRNRAGMALQEGSKDDLEVRR